ncbi:MAG: helix-turn-helix domain-containing protein [Syntrophobacteraceae bacterium]
MPPKYLNEKQVAELTGFAVQTLRNDRFLGRRIPYLKIGKSVRYDLNDVVEFMERHKVKPVDRSLPMIDVF